MGVEQEFGDQVHFIGVPSLTFEVDAIIDFTSSTGRDAFLNIPDFDGELWNQFGVREHRTYVLINDDGTWELANYGNLRADVEDLIGR